MEAADGLPKVNGKFSPDPGLENEVRNFYEKQGWKISSDNKIQR